MLRSLAAVALVSTAALSPVNLTEAPSTDRSDPPEVAEHVADPRAAAAHEDGAAGKDESGRELYDYTYYHFHYPYYHFHYPYYHLCAATLGRGPHVPRPLPVVWKSMNLEIWKSGMQKNKK